MISEGEIVRIVASDALSDMRLDGLVGQKGRVTHVLPVRRNAGCMVHFKDRFLGERNWFIPIASIETRHQVEKNQSKSLVCDLKI